MPNRSAEVERFMEALDHPLKAEIEELRSAILDSDDRITEQIKWKAPSFCFAGDDRVTFRLQPKNIFQLIFHRGAKVKDSTGFTFDDATGLLHWAAPDRGVVTLTDREDVRAKQAVIVALVNRWMDSTA